MTVIRGNDVITINGRRINVQGAAHLRDDVSPADAAAKTKGNGMDEMIIGLKGKDGKSERVLIWGDHLDFRFREREAQPEIKINGQRGVLIHYDDEQNTFVEGAVNGVVTGIRNAFDAVETLAKNSIQGVALAGAASLVGGTIWVAATKGAALEIIKTAIMTLGPGIATTAGMLSLSAVGLVVLAGAVKGAFGALQNPPKMETITGLINDQPQGQSQSNNPQPPLVPPYRPTDADRRVRPTANNANVQRAINALPTRAIHVQK
jgi:hypothetical protein